MSLNKKFVSLSIPKVEDIFVPQECPKCLALQAELYEKNMKHVKFMLTHFTPQIKEMKCKIIMKDEQNKEDEISIFGYFIKYNVFCAHSAAKKAEVQLKGDSIIIKDFDIVLPTPEELAEELEAQKTDIDFSEIIEFLNQKANVSKK